MILPPALLEQLCQLPFFDQESFVAAHQQKAPTSIRLHPIKGNSISLQNKSPIPWCSSAYYLPERPIFTIDPLLHAGAYYVQEASSMFLDHIFTQLFANNEQLRVLDLCAAPGGKSTLLASRLGESSLLISNDVIRSRAAILEENMTRWGYNNTWVSSNDPRDFGRIDSYFDLMLVDAPCSGSGLFRKDERVVNEWSEANVQLCSERQQRILADVWTALKKDGYLVYATCSYAAAENEDVLDFMADNFDLESLTINYDKEWGIETTYSAKHKMEGYRFFPDKVQGEGFFVAVVKKKNGEETLNLPKFRTAHNRKIAEQAGHLLQAAPLHFIANERGFYSAIFDEHEVDYQFLKQYIYLRRAGTLIGSPAAKEWIPEHDIALSVFTNPNLDFIDLDLESALLFLKKEFFELPHNTPKGWYIVRYKGQGLGWIKSLGNRINNYLPKNWRIRMDIDFEAL